jgi:hypothetical protein
MSHPVRHPRLLAVLLACALSCLPLPAAAQSREPAVLSPRAFFAHLAGLLGLAPMVAALGLDNGCEIDPSGRCLRRALELDNGCQIDPSGQCLPQALDVDNGCQIDPDGRPISSCVAVR